MTHLFKMVFQTIIFLVFYYTSPFLTVGLESKDHLSNLWRINSIASTIAIELPSIDNISRSPIIVSITTMTNTRSTKAASEAAAKRRQQEKTAAAAAFKAGMDKAKATREANKKKRAEEKKLAEEKTKEENRKKKEEEKKKKEEDAKKKAEAARKKAEELAAADDAPDEDINSILQGLNAADKLADEVLAEEKEVVEVEDDEEVEEEEEEGANSPEKKKKKTTSSNKRDTPSNLRKGKYATAAKHLAKEATGGTGRKKAVQVSPSSAPHDHKHKRVIIQGGVELDGEDTYGQFGRRIQSFLTNGQFIDPTLVINSVVQGAADDITRNKDVPGNMALLGKHVKISGGNKGFQPQKVWTKYKENPDGPDEYKVPTVYFSMAISLDHDPEDFLSSLSIEWGRVGGVKLEMKHLQTFNSSTPVAVYLLYNLGHQPTLIKELTTILEEARNIGMENSMEENWEEVPSLTFRLNVPRLPGQDTSAFNKYSRQENMARKVLHVECDTKQENYVKELVQIAKDVGLVEKMWGRQCHISEVVNKDSTTAGEIKRLISISQNHTTFCVTFTMEEIKGIVDLDRAVPFYDEEDPSTEAGKMSLRDVLYSFLKMSDDLPLIAEMHQRGVMGVVEVVIPNIPVAEQMVLMMNKNVAAYLLYYLVEQGIDKDFVMALLKKSVEPTLLAEAKDCKWDNETWTLTTAKELKEDGKQSDYQKASWWKANEVANRHLSKQKNKDKQYADPAVLYNMNEERSVKTLHEKNDNRYEGDFGAPVIDLSGKFKGPDEEVIELAQDDEVTSVSNLSEKSSASNTGSAPDKDKNKSHSTTSVNGVGDGSEKHDKDGSPPESSAASHASENVAASG